MMNGMSGLSELLEALDRDQLKVLLLRPAARHPDLADEIAAEVAIAQVRATPPAAPARPPVDIGPLQRQVSALLDRPYRGYDPYATSSSIARGMDAILDQVRGFVEGGDSANALRLLEAITDEYVASWQDFDDSYGNLGGVFDGLGELWAEALLGAELSPEELEEWAERLAEWGGDRLTTALTMA